MVKGVESQDALSTKMTSSEPCRLPGLELTDHFLFAPLDHQDPEGRELQGMALSIDCKILPIFGVLVARSQSPEPLSKEI